MDLREIRIVAGEGVVAYQFTEADRVLTVWAGPLGIALAPVDKASGVQYTRVYPGFTKLVFRETDESKLQDCVVCLNRRSVEMSVPVHVHPKTTVTEVIHIPCSACRPDDFRKALKVFREAPVAERFDRLASFMRFSFPVTEEK